MRLTSLLALLVLWSAGFTSFARAIELFPEEELKPGLKGQVTTALHGPELETLEVEILGVLDDGIGPGVDLILGRLLGEKGDWNGVAAGMSGSPVTIDGRLVGALSYSVGQFAKEPICGITPIRAMLRLTDYPGGMLPWSAADARSTLHPVPLALTVRGVSTATLSALDDAWPALGFTARAEFIPASAAPRATQPAPLRPGDPVAGLLVWGDLEIGATGTVTWRDGDRVLAFGHPFFGSGRTALPLARAEVVWTVPSLLNSFKIARIGEPIGTLEQDRLTAIAGEIGVAPRGIPLTVSIDRGPAAAVVRHYFVAVDPLLTPALVSLALRATLLDELGAERDEALSLRGTITLAGGRKLNVSASSANGAGGSGGPELANEIARRVNELMRPPIPVPEVAEIDIQVRTVAPEGTWTVERALPDRLAARPGETVTVWIDLSGTRDRRRREALRLTVPADLAPGRYALLAGSERGVAVELGTIWEARRRTARNADDYLAAVSAVPSDATLALTLADPGDGLVTGGREYPDLPTTAGLLMKSRPGGGELYRSRWLALASATRDLERNVSGLARLTIEVLGEVKGE